MASYSGGEEQSERGICLVVSMNVEARSSFKKILSEGEPGTCSDIGGLWEGECIEEGKARNANNV